MVLLTLRRALRFAPDRFTARESDIFRALEARRSELLHLDGES